MSWEAYRWTAKSPSELYEILGPHGVDHLVRQMLDTCWRESPAEGRSLTVVKKIAQEVFDRNMAVWLRIKKPSPAAFFENLLPNAADGFLRQAMVLCWMMLPRTGGRQLGDVRKIVAEIYNRNLAAWEQDNATFTRKKKAARAKKAAPRPRKVLKRATVKRKPKKR
jgi:hypothetical protein